MIRTCIFLVLTQIIYCQFLYLFRLDLQINEDCWVLNTNNMTEIGMGNCQDQVYFVNLGLGTPPLFANFQIDTFRDLIWYPLNETYANSSETFEITNKTTLTYMHRSIYEASVGSDIVSVLQTNISTRSSVAWANKTMDLPVFPQIDGVLGLGYSEKPNFLDNAALDNQINSSIFALQMGGFGQPSVLYYGQLPQFLQDSNIYVPVIGSSLWQVQILNIRIDGFDFSNIAAKKMIIDTTTGLMYLNPNFYKKLMSKYFTECTIDANKMPTCPCRYDWPDIQFIFEQVSIKITPEAYLKRNEGGCLLMIGQTLQEDSPIMMGGSLMRNYIITFDKQNKQVGFNGTPLGSWRYLFIIFELIMITLAMIALGVAIYLVMTIRYIKSDKLEKKQKKVKKGKQKLLQLTSAHFSDS